MKIFVAIFIVCTLLQVNAQPEATCSLEYGDGKPPKVMEYSLRFLGPSNEYWHYVDKSPDSWIFEVITKQQRSKAIQFERAWITTVGLDTSISPKHLTDLSKEIVFINKTKFTIKKERIEAIVSAFGNSKVPTDKQHRSFIFGFEIHDESSKWSDYWNFDCSIGFGFNSLNARFLDSKTKKPLANYSFSISRAHLGEVAPPVINGKTDKDGRYFLKGLPAGMLAFNLASVNSQKIATNAVSYVNFNAFDQSCEFEFTSPSEKSSYWTISKNTCATSQQR